jgi:two-component system LytT family response regulator
MTRIYIIDDEPAAIALLKKLLKENYQVNIVGEGNDVTPETIESLVAANPDLIFLDVEMPSGTGLDFWTNVKPMLKPETKVVFYTGWDKYILDALRRQAFDYMLKPATLPELQKIMTRYLEQRLQELTTRNTVANPSATKLLVTNFMGVMQAKTFDEIAFFRFNTERKLWEVVTTDGQTSLLRHRTTAEVITGFSPALVQIHKRYIVNTQKISHIEDQLCMLEPPLQHCRELHISKNYRPNLLSTFYNL